MFYWFKLAIVLKNTFPPKILRFSARLPRTIDRSSKKNGKTENQDRRPKKKTETRRPSPKKKPEKEARKPSPKKKTKTEDQDRRPPQQIRPPPWGGSKAIRLNQPVGPTIFLVFFVRNLRRPEQCFPFFLACRIEKSRVYESVFQIFVFRFPKGEMKLYLKFVSWLQTTLCFLLLAGNPHHCSKGPQQQCNRLLNSC